MQRMGKAYDASKRYNIDLLSAIHFVNFSWEGLAPSKVANCFAHAGFFRTVVSDPDGNQPDDDRTGNDIYTRLFVARGDFEAFALADAAAPVVVPETDAQIIYTWWPRRGRRDT
ncbi:hypothetical protein HPB48_003097 [Haemaphysalis longicornis]|uniref:Uncharacterized protein n=1 Tax=Haemaphysalis longicornis TaxID=44386 RepID=A0A9J6FX81_HAELO|nr:hypothetical protein HPB48_003097 [Haemaphysalis longicornis]